MKKILKIILIILGCWWSIGVIVMLFEKVSFSSIFGVLFFGILSFIHFYIAIKYLKIDTNDIKKLDIQNDKKRIISNTNDLKEFKTSNDIQSNIKNNNPISDNQNDRISYNINYQLPDINILEDESKNIIPFLQTNNLKEEVYIPIGTNESGKIIFENICDMPNFLISGTVMTGKSTYINTIISSILLTKKPNIVKLIIYDSKKIDYTIYNGIPHLMCPIITNAQKFSKILSNIVKEIDNRYDQFEEIGIKNIISYNNIIDEKNKQYKDNIKYQYMPYIIIIIDDYSILNQYENNDENIEYITQLGWNVGVHMIVSTNHPSTKVMSTISKANFPTRLSFKVVSSLASRTILDCNGAEKLNDIGMALYLGKKKDKLEKIAVPNICEKDIKKIIDYTISQQKAMYDEKLMNLNTSFESSKIDENIDAKEKYEDPLYDEIVEFVVIQGKASASLIQRRFKISYNRAARIIDLLEERGIIGPQNGSKPREILVKFEDEN